MSITDTIQLLQKVILDENCGRMNMSTVKGYLGELIVKEQLESEGFFVEHKGNQTGYDLALGQDCKYKIDVKTSLLKFELSNEYKNWGWALKHENKKKAISATHFICVGLDDKLEPSQFIIIPASLVEIFPKSIGQFKRVNNALFVFPPSPKPMNLSDDSKRRIEECKRILQDKSIKVLYHGQSFRNVFS